MSLLFAPISNRQIYVSQYIIFCRSLFLPNTLSQRWNSSQSNSSWKLLSPLPISSSLPVNPCLITSGLSTPVDLRHEQGHHRVCPLSRQLKLTMPLPPTLRLLQTHLRTMILKSLVQFLRRSLHWIKVIIVSHRLPPPPPPHILLRSIMVCLGNTLVRAIMLLQNSHCLSGLCTF